MTRVARCSRVSSHEILRRTVRVSMLILGASFFVVVVDQPFFPSIRRRSKQQHSEILHLSRVVFGRNCFDCILRTFSSSTVPQQFSTDPTLGTTALFRLGCRATRIVQDNERRTGRSKQNPRNPIITGSEWLFDRLAGRRYSVGCGLSLMEVFHRVSNISVR